VYVGLLHQNATTGGSTPSVFSPLWHASSTCLMLFDDCILAAASRTFCTAGRSSPIRMAMIAITTKSSISVKARRQRGREIITTSERGLK